MGKLAVFRRKGWKGCLGDGSWAATLALWGQHFRKPIHRSQAGEAPGQSNGACGRNFQRRGPEPVNLLSIMRR
jgi:hypothetical protein